MKEALSLEYQSEAEATIETDFEWLDFKSGSYHDPDEQIVEKINQVTSIPGNAKLALMTALELSGAIKSAQELTQSLEKTGALPRTGQNGEPVYPSQSDSKFLKNREEQLLGELKGEEQLLNLLSDKIDRTIGRWLAYDEADKDAVWAYGRNTSRQEVPEPLQIIMAMAGRRPTESGEYLDSLIPEESLHLATAAYWMLRQELQS